MRLYPLSTLSAEAARSQADIHLRPSVTIIAKILSDAAHLVVGRDNIPGKENSLGEKMYKINEAIILPPSGITSVWSKWAASNYMNAWWLVDFAFQLNAEFKHRFGSETNEYLSKLQPWIVNGLMKVFPKPAKDGSFLAEFPVVLPPQEVIALGDIARMSVVDIYRSHYALQKGKVRMKWTNRAKPDFIYFDDKTPF